MRHPAAILQALSRTDLIGKRFLLLGNNSYVKQVMKAELSRFCTFTQNEDIDPVGVRSSALYLRDLLLTAPMPWDYPLIWVEQADILLSAMTFPDDFPVSRHLLVLYSESEQVYSPPSFIPVSLSLKGNSLTDLIRWMLQRRVLNSEPDAVKFLASEYKENLPSLEKLIDQMSISIHPRTVLSMKDLESEDEGWDTTLLLTSIVKNDEQKLLTEMTQALETFHPKGIITVLTRRVSLLMQVASANVLSGGQPEESEIRPWVWRQNVELVKEIPLNRLAQWAILLDKCYFTLQRGTTSMRWVLSKTLLEMARPVS